MEVIHEDWPRRPRGCACTSRRYVMYHVSRMRDLASLLPYIALEGMLAYDMLAYLRHHAPLREMRVRRVHESDKLPRASHTILELANHVGEPTPCMCARATSFHRNPQKYIVYINAISKSVLVQYDAFRRSSVALPTRT